MGGKSAPKAPDYTALADKTFDAQKDLLEQQTSANRPNQTNQWGNVNWTQDDEGNWTQSTTLNPYLQGQLENQQMIGSNLAGLASGMFGDVQGSFDTPFDYSQFGDMQGLEYDPTELRQKAEDASYQRATSRLDPRFSQEANDLQVSLRNRGLVEGDEAYDNAMRNFNMQKEDAYSNAQNLAVQQGMSEASQLYNQQVGSAGFANNLRQQQIAEALKNRYMPLSEMQSLMGGNVSAPNFGNFNQATTTNAPDYLNAGNMQSNAQQAQFQQQQGGWNNLANLGLTAGMLFSDERLKDDVIKIGESNGLNVYQWNWNDDAKQFGLAGQSQGHLAGEVELLKPELVSEIGGYKCVDYGGLYRQEIN